MTKKRLGRGLAALLGTEEGGFEPGSLDTAELIQVAVDQVDPNPFQPRRTFDPTEIASLADSLRQHGMLQPILVRPVEDRYQLIAGERRLRAAIEARLHEVPARIMDLDDQRVSELAMVENLQREDLNALDKGRAFEQYLETYGGTQEELASRLGLDRSTIANLIRLLDLPESVQDALRSKKISQGHARAILGLGTAEEREAACRRVLAEGLSVRQTEALVQSGVPTPSKVRGRRDAGEDQSGSAKAPHILEFEGHLSQRFGTPVLVKLRSAKRGQIVIDFNSPEEFERLAGIIRGVG